MKTTICLCALAAVFLAVRGPHASGLGLQAGQEPPKAIGRVLVLDNERVLEGDVFRQGDQFVLRQAAGELKIPANKALTVCASLEEAYKFLSGRANLRDASERLRLARWCQSHGLREQAIAEAKSALQLRPGQAEAKQLLAMLEYVAPTVASAPSIAAAPAPSAPPLLDLTTECLALFAAKVQPILMNTCASCHASPQDGSGFTLTRVGANAERRVMHMNLGAVIKHINFDQPAASPLLDKACSAHGGAPTAALANRQGTPFVTLQTFVQMVVAQNPQLRPHGTTAAAALPQTAPQYPGPKTVAGAVSPPQDSPAARAVEISPALTPIPSLDSAARPVEMVPSMTVLPGSNGTPTPRPVEFSSSTSPSAIAEAAAASLSGPYDPRPFNEMAHSKR